MYEVQEYDPESGLWVTVFLAEGDSPIRVKSYRYVPTVIFETEAQEYNG